MTRDTTSAQSEGQSENPNRRPLQAANSPQWLAENPTVRRGFQEVWHLKLTDPEESRALWLAFTVLSSQNGFKKVAETWAIHFARNEGREVSKTALKQTYAIPAFSTSKFDNPDTLAGPDGGATGFKIGDCEFGQGFTRGCVTSKGREIKWDLRFEVAQESSFNLIPDTLRRSRLVSNQAVTIAEDLRFTGLTELDGVKSDWKNAPGMQGHLYGPRNAFSWTWGHCNTFFNERGDETDAVFEGLTARVRLLGPILTPKISSFYFRYRGEEYKFNSLRDAIHSRSQNSLNDWKFQAERGDVRFVGHAKAEYRDFAGLTFEDTDGSLLYCSNASLADLSLHVYRRGKLEATLKSTGSASFEIVSRKQNPYVPLLI